MRILTVRQPWAWAIIHGGKDVENRTRNIAGDYRGPVAIHAGRVPFDPWGPVAEALHQILGWIPGADRLIYGAIIGVVDLTGAHHPWACYYPYDDKLCSRWADIQCIHLVLANPRPLPEPIPYKGALGLRELPAEVEALIWAQIEPS